MKLLRDSKYKFNKYIKLERNMIIDERINSEEVIENNIEIIRKIKEKIPFICLNNFKNESYFLIENFSIRLVTKDITLKKIRICQYFCVNFREFSFI